MNSINQAEDGLSLEEITIDIRLQFRCGRGPFGCDPAVIERYAMEMRDGDVFPPILVVELSEQFEDHGPGTLLLVGGFTRFCAAQAAGLTSLAARIRPGTWADAKKMAWSQNSDHGQPRTKNDLRRIIEAVRADDPDVSIRQIAKLVDCSKWMVHSIIGVAEPKPAATSGCPAPDTQTPPREIRTGNDSGNDVDDAEDSPSSGPVNRTKDDSGEITDPFAEVRAGRRMAVEIAAELKARLKQVETLKMRPGGAAVKFGVCEKHLEEVRRHLLYHCPAYGLTDEARRLAGDKDPSHGRGWLTETEAGRLPENVLKTCVKF